MAVITGMGNDYLGSDEFTTQCCKTSGDFFVVVADKCLCTGNAFATARADIELCANFRERGRTGVHRSTDGSVGNVVADANNHGGLVMCKCEQFVFRVLTKPCSIARGFFEFLPGASKRRNRQRGWVSWACGLRSDGGLGWLQGSVDNAAAETDVPVIKHRGLARSDRPLRLYELQTEASAW
jgi:hypothetical protein